MPQIVHEARQRFRDPRDRSIIGQRQMDDIIAAQCHRQSAPVQWQFETALARPFRIWRASPGLAIVWLLAGGLELLLVGGTLATALMPAWWLLSRGTYWGAVLLLVTTAPAALLLGIVARTTFAYAIIEVTAGARGPVQALSVGLRKASRDWPALIAILVSGDLLTALGSLLCGAGALPGLPFADLALLHRWASLEEER